MSYLYPRQKKEIVTINGIFDDFSDNVFSGTRWFETFVGAQVVSSIVTAPGGIGGYALKLLGTIANGLDPMVAQGGMSPYPNKSKLYYINPQGAYKWKMKAEFRLRIAADQVDATNFLAHSAGFCLDGNVNWSDDHNEDRTVVYFSVANQKAGIVSGTTPAAANILTSVAWTGAIDIWYDIRIEWEYDWYYWIYWRTGPTDPPIIKIPVKIYVNNLEIIDYEIESGQWRDEGNVTTEEYHIPLGRCGPHVNIEDQAALATNTVEAYYKDILISTDIRHLDFSYSNSILIKGGERQAKALIKVDSSFLINEGDDFQIWERNTLTDDWNGSFRGIIRSVERPPNNILTVEAESYESVLIGESGENLSYTTQTAGYIVDDVINSPDTYLFDTSTYFDAAAATYSRDYLTLPKLDIISEMGVLANFIIYLDAGNNWHFQSIKSNDTDIYLRWGKDRIIGYKHEDVFVRKPNFLRVVGSGVYAERELSTNVYSSSSMVTRIIKREDLTTQAEVDDALDYYMSSYLESVKLLTLNLRANHRIKKGNIIRIHLPQIGMINVEFIVIELSSNRQQRMKITMLEVKPESLLVLSDLSKRTDSQESEGVPTDETATAKNLHIEGVANLLVSGYYRIIDDGGIVREGQAVITDYCLQYLLEVLNDEISAGANKFPDTVCVGTGTTPAKPSDTALENETASNSTINSGSDIQKEIGTLGGGSVQLRLGANYYVTNWAGGTLSEVGIKRGSNLFLRAVFDSYTPNGIYDVYTWIKIFPVPGPCMFQSDFHNNLTYYLDDDDPKLSTVFDRGVVVGTDTFTVPNLYINEETESGGEVVVCPKSSSDGTLTRTKITTRNIIKYEYTYTFDYTNDRYDPADGDKQVAWIGLTYNDNSRKTYLSIFYRNDKMLSEFDGYDCKFIFWIKLKRGDINLTPRLTLEDP